MEAFFKPNRHFFSRWVDMFFFIMTIKYYKSFSLFLILMLSVFQRYCWCMWNICAMQFDESIPLHWKMQVSLLCKKRKYLKIPNTQIYEYANIFHPTLLCWTQNISSFTVKSILSLGPPEASGFHFTLVYAEYWTRLGFQMSFWSSLAHSLKSDFK